MNNQGGFTVIEVFIGSFVVATLVMLALVGYGAYDTHAYNDTKRDNLQQWDATFQAYKQKTGQYPALSNGSYCLGQAFPSDASNLHGACGQYKSPNEAISEQASIPLIEELKNATTRVPDTEKRPLANRYVGPWLEKRGDEYLLVNVFKDACPSELAFIKKVEAGISVCGITRSSDARVSQSSR